MSPNHVKVVLDFFKTVDSLACWLRGRVKPKVEEIIRILQNVSKLEGLAASRSVTLCLKIQVVPSCIAFINCLALLVS